MQNVHENVNSDHLSLVADNEPNNNPGIAPYIQPVVENSVATEQNKYDMEIIFKSDRAVNPNLILTDKDYFIQNLINELNLLKLVC